MVGRDSCVEECVYCDLYVHWHVLHVHVGQGQGEGVPGAVWRPLQEEEVHHAAGFPVEDERGTVEG